MTKCLHSFDPEIMSFLIALMGTARTETFCQQVGDVLSSGDMGQFHIAAEYILLEEMIGSLDVSQPW